MVAAAISPLLRRLELLESKIVLLAAGEHEQQQQSSHHAGLGEPLPLHHHHCAGTMAESGEPDTEAVEDKEHCKLDEKLRDDLQLEEQAITPDPEDGLIDEKIAELIQRQQELAATRKQEEATQKTIRDDFVLPALFADVEPSDKVTSIASASSGLAAATVERRRANDGRWYTKQQFEKFYGSSPDGRASGARRWEAAANLGEHFGPSSATEEKAHGESTIREGG